MKTYKFEITIGDWGCTVVSFLYILSCYLVMLILWINGLPLREDWMLFTHVFILPFMILFWLMEKAFVKLRKK